MLKVMGCFADAHDLRLVALAAAVCALAAFTAVAVLRHAARTGGVVRGSWLAVAAVAGGTGIWATHFVAMLAFAPGLDASYDLSLTALSLAYAVALAGAGFGMSLSPLRHSAMLGGTILGGGIAAMHYTGMAAYTVAARVSWDIALVVLSVVVGAALAAAALSVALSARGTGGRGLAAGLLMLAICGHHFTAMGAATLTPDPTLAPPLHTLPPGWLAVAVALAGFVILLLACAALGIDLRDRRNAADVAERLRNLANAAMEGLVVCRGDVVVSANESFATLVGAEPQSLAGALLTEYIPRAAWAALVVDPEQALEVDLRLPNGTGVPVEILGRRVEYAKVPHLAVAVRDLRARRRAERQIQFLAHNDPLTGLANRTSFAKRLEADTAAADARGGKLAVLCLDLDRFKEVNDLFGHAAGDALLESVARTVTGLLGEGQAMARLGGDEFAVLTPCEGPAEAARLAEAILDAFADSAGDLTGPQPATSVGIALYPDDAGDRAGLMACADTALYRAKSDGRGTYRFYEARMGAETRERRSLGHDLRHAVSRGELRLLFQPQAATGTGDVTGFEALLRWHHPERGSVSPAAFIPIAEESGAILQIGEWVLREACREAATWGRHLTVAVNVSGMQVLSPGFVETLHGILLQTGLPAARLEVEITETALIRDPARALLVMRQLKALGIGIAMDDFGTGYSSLSNLRSFPFDKIKIDGSFVRSVNVNEQAATIVRAVLGLGRGLGLVVLAEGVETPEELGFLEREHCGSVQGYLVGRPAPIGEFAHVVGAAGLRPAA